MSLAGGPIVTVSGLSPLSADNFVSNILLIDNQLLTYQRLVALIDDDTTVDSRLYAGPTEIEVGAGNDSVLGGPGDTLVRKWKSGNLVFNGEDGTDTLVFETATGAAFPEPTLQQLIVDLSTGTGQNPYGGSLTLSSVENVSGTLTADIITGSDQANRISARGGADIINAGAGDDTVLLDTTSVNVSVSGGAGTDTLLIPMSSGPPVLDLSTPSNNRGATAGGTFSDFEIFRVSDSSQFSFVFRGDGGANIVYGNDGPLIVLPGEDGLYGQDSLSGEAGDDYLDGQKGSDTIEGGAGNDTIVGGLGNDIAVFAGARASYAIALDQAAGGVRITDLRAGSPDGSDILRSIEHLQFSDQTIAAPFNPRFVSISSFNAVLTEGNFGTKSFSFRLTLDEASSTTVTVGYQVSGIGVNPANSADFPGAVFPTGQVTIAAGATSTTFSVQIQTDTIPELDEGFLVSLINPSAGLVIATASAAGTIRNDDLGVATDGPDLLFGTSGPDSIAALGGNDTVLPGAGNDTVDGGPGTDQIVYSVARSGAALTRNTDGSVQIAGGSSVGTDQLRSIERIDFSDGDFVFDVVGSQTTLVYLLYQAAFARTPDEEGFRYWADTVDRVGISTLSLAREFRTSQEFALRYGANPSDYDYTYNMYRNVLGREPDQGGIVYWTTQVSAGVVSRDQLLIEFATSQENVNLTRPNVEVGYWVV